MLSKVEIRGIWIMMALYIVANAISIYFEFYFFNLIPAILVMILFALFSLEKVFWFIVFFTPLSLNLDKFGMGGISISVPTEPILFLIMILFIIKLFHRFEYDKKVLTHPITLAILFQLIWLLITSLTSVRPVVSFKFLISRMWFIITFYFIAIQIFKNPEKIRQYLWFYIVPLTIVVLYTITNHYLHGFDDKPSHFVMKPFFKDHTSYGAVLVMIFPALVYLFYSYDKLSMKIYTGVLLFIYSAGIVFSFTRAAWLSLAGAGVLWLIYRFKVKFQVIIFAGIVALFFLMASWSQIMMKLEKNREESSSNFTEHIQSMSNISSDASNLERLNRWESAFKMFAEKPIFGWGPGTYMFEYAPFQHSQSLTIISTNAGKMGNAHSEYIGPLAESGILGSLSFIMIIILVFVYGSRLYHRLPNGKDKSLILSLILGFSTYVAHGFLNNYLDTDKASALFWGFIAVIVAYDVYQKNLLTESDTH